MVTIMLLFKVIRAMICGFSSGSVMLYNLFGSNYVWEIQHIELLVLKETFEKAKEEKKRSVLYGIALLNGLIFLFIGFEIILIRGIIKDIKKIRGGE